MQLTRAAWAVPRVIRAAGRPVRAQSTAAAVPPTFEHLGLRPAWIQRLRRAGIHQPTATQAAALPPLLAGRNAVLKAETGSGKTLAYLLPLLDSLLTQSELSVGGAAPLLTHPSALVVVPTQELVRQVVAVASSLVPELAHTFRAVYANKGVPRRDACSLIVATPLALKENVNYHHFAAVRHLVLDECDMLLSGSFYAITQAYILGTFKQRTPDTRPQHIFTAATIPARGVDSVGAFLDKYYPEADGVLRIATAGAHRPVDTARQLFLQIDAALPLTPEEVAARRRLQQDIQKVLAAARDTGASAAAAGGGGDADVVPAAASGASGRVADVDADDDLTDASASGGARSDKIEAVMAARAAEDRARSVAAAKAAHMDVVENVRRKVLLEALLLPAALAARERANAAAAASASAIAGSGVAAAPPSTSGGGAGGGGGAADAASDSTLTRAQRRRAAVTPVSVLAAHALKPTAAAAAAATTAASARLRRVDASGMAARAAAAASGVNPLLASGVVHEATPSTVVQVTLPEPARAKLSEVEARSVPSTIVFVASAEAADATRKWLLKAAPTLRVAAVHAGVDDDDRAALLSDFASGTAQVLVATDVAARGVDTTHVKHVIQAEFASDVVSHLHRSGRTARAGRSGIVTNLVTRPGLTLANAALEASREGQALDAVFSRRRSLRRAARKAVLTKAEETAIMAVLEQEQAALAGGGGEVAAAPPLA